MNPIINMLKKSTQDYVKESVTLIKSSNKSRQGLIVPELVFEYGSLKNNLMKLLNIMPWLGSSLLGRMNGYWSLKKNPDNPKKIINEDFINELSRYIKKVGCSDFSCIEVPKKYIFKDKSILYSHAIVITQPMSKEKMKFAPQTKAGHEVWRVYNSLGNISNKIARYLRKHGYGAQAGAALGGDSNYTVLAQLAGLGWIGKHGLLISPQNGPSQRLAVVYTSIENLPKPRENRYSWIADFCNKCNKCVKKCPAGAIYKEKPVMDDGGPKHIDYTKCIIPFSKSMGCSICLKECPFFSKDVEILASKMHLDK